MRTFGGSHLFVIDVDVADGKPGRESLIQLEGRLGRLPATVSVETGSGGRQYYLLTTADLPNTTGRLEPNGRIVGLAPAVDTRGRGGFVVSPPSLHKTGRRYRWLAGCSPWDISVARLPATWEREVLSVAAPVRVHAPKRTATAADQAPRFSLAKATEICAAVFEHPAWRWAMDHPDDVDRATWLGFANNLASAMDGHPELRSASMHAFRSLSEGYARYDEREADGVLSDALTYIASGGGPSSWEKMPAVPPNLTGSARNLVEDARALVFRTRRVPPQPTGGLHRRDASPDCARSTQDHHGHAPHVGA